MKKLNELRLRMHDTGGITEGVIWKQLLLFFFPIVFGTFFQQLYNTVDAVVVGRFVGKEALAAVGGSTAAIINLLVGFFVGLSSGATVIISQYYGAQKYEETSRATHTAIALAIASGFLLMVIGISITPWALRLVDTPEEILEDSISYMRIYFTGMVPALTYNIGSGILRAVGDARRPLYYLIASCLTNIVLDVLFVCVFNMGVAGAAIATSISEWVSAVLIITAMVRTTDCYQLIIKEIRFAWDMLVAILKIGIPAGLQSVLYSVSHLIVQTSINSFGTDTVAAWTAYSKLDAFFWMVIGAFGVSITTFVGQNFGARKYDRVHKSVKTCMIMAMGFTVFMSAFCVIFGEPLYHIFADDDEVIRLGMVMLKAIAPMWFTYVSIEILSGAVRGAGDVFVPTILTCFGVCGLRIVWVYVFVPHWNTITSVVAAYPITWSIASILYIIYYLNGGWLRRRREAAGDPVRPEEMHRRHRCKT